ncbi:serine/threonine-protein kinase [Streptomyces sp. NPDC052051]|uniref:serine/threonine-protein kinase n=1 Tax=Streptomyces sp. NPDC052051 TaxID=3154649 RepID=UPI003433C411
MEKLAAGDPPRIGAYRLLARLGAGGMGSVYLARSDRGRTVAVKLVRQELAEREEFRARFRQEVRAARRVGGHWTAPVLDADTEAAIPWVATGYVAGPTLQTVISHDHGPLPERSVRILAAGLAHALQDIHAAGLIHRDLKPSNVLVTIDGPRVIDFGIARALETLTDDGLTRTGAFVGSPGFMAPEQVRGDRITPACDVFCLGSVLAFAATGALPFGAAGSGAHALMFRIAQEEPDLTDLPEELADLVRDCLRKDPAARPTPAQILERTGAEDTVSGGRSRDPWLPSALVAQLGRQAVRLLDTEDPEEAAPAPTASPAAPVDLVKRPGPAPAGGAPEASPEHAPAADAPDGAVSPPPGPADLDRLPTQAVGSGHPPPPDVPPAAHPVYSPPDVPPVAQPPAAHPAYGFPQQHPQPPVPAYGPPQGGGWGGAPAPGYGPALGSAPAYGPPPYAGHPYGDPGQGDPGQPPPRRRSSRSTVALLIAAVVVAIGAGGSVYALMRGDGSTRGGGSTVATSPGPTTSDAPTRGATSGPPSTPASRSPEAGLLPTAYLGTWDTSIDNDKGHHTRRLVIQQGEVGDTVLSLSADGPADNGATYHCLFLANLTERPSGDGPVEIGPSKVSAGPAESCAPGEPTELTLLPDGRLERLNTTTGATLTFTRAD